MLTSVFAPAKKQGRIMEFFQTTTLRGTILFLALALAGCKTAISTDIFTSDLLAAANGDKLTAPMVIGMEAGSEDKCNETAPTALEAIRTAYKTAEFIGCESINYDVFARFRTQAPIISFDTAAPTPDTAFAIGVQKDGAHIHISYLTNPTATRAIWDALPKDMTEYQSYKFEPLLSASLTNDLRDTVIITTDDVFADGIPIQGSASRDLPRRDQVELMLSDVTNAAFGNTENASHIVTFTMQE